MLENDSDMTVWQPLLEITNF